MKNWLRKIQFHPETIAAAMEILLLAVFLIVVINVGFIWPLYLFCVGLSFLISVIYPRAGFFAMLLAMMIYGWSFALTPLVFDNLEVKLFPVDAVFLGILLGTFFQIAGKKITFRFEKADFLILGFISFTFLYFLLSFKNPESFFQLSFSALKNYGFYSLLYFTSALLFQEEADRQRLIRFFGAGAVAIIGFIVYGILNGEGLWVDITPLSTAGTRTLGFYHAFYVSLAFLGALSYLAFGKGKDNALLKIVIVFWSAGIVGSLMRHLWIGIFFGVWALYSILGPNQRKTIRQNIFGYFGFFMAMIVFVVYLSFIFPQSGAMEKVNSVGAFVATRVNSFSDVSADDSFAWREMVWNGVWEKYRSHPFLGFGLGEKIYVSQEKYNEIVEVRNIHNSPLIILVQMGIIPIVLLLSAVWILIRQAWKKGSASQKDWFSRGLLSMLVFYLFIFMFQPYLELNILSLPFWIILGLLRSDE